LTDGSEFVGLTQALYGAGARAVVASLWEVDDEATALLMRRFYRNWTGRGSKQPPQSAAVALAEARRWLRDLERDGRHPFAHPVYWAGFVLTGVCD
jgi:CHAT domain-containing protein